jgi:hypothetical protein
VEKELVENEKLSVKMKNPLMKTEKKPVDKIVKSAE